MFLNTSKASSEPGSVFKYFSGAGEVYQVLGQNGSGQNGTDKMVWTKWYTDKMVSDKMVRTKRYGQNGTDKTLTIKSSINTLIPLTLTK